MGRLKTHPEVGEVGLSVGVIEQWGGPYASPFGPHHGRWGP